MIYLFYGEDAKSKKLSYDKFIKALPSGTELFPISRNGFDKSQIESLYSGAGLFFAKSATIFSGILDYEDTREFILEKLPLLAGSENIFIFLESKLNKPVLDIFKKNSAKIEVFELPKEKKEKFDNFLLANAFGNKDKLNLWIYFRQAVDGGASLEELVGILFWKIKDMLLKKDFRKFSQAELQNLAAKLSYLLPKARREARDAEAALEQFLLEAF